MHHSRKDDPIDIGQNFLERLALLGWLCWQRGTNCPWFAVRRNAQRFYFSPIIRDPIRQPMQLLPENLRRGVTEFVSHQLIGRKDVSLSKSETKTEMECAEILMLARTGIDAVIEPDRADGEFIA